MKGKVWVLDTATKGTGAHMVPLEEIEARPEPRGHAPVWVPPKHHARGPAPPPPRQPRRFRVVDVVTGEALADGAGLRATLGVLRELRSSVDVRVFVWEPAGERWRLLTLAEQQAVWDRREA